ncbi:hypothetical protein O0I10_012987 [Lichtheimia ornata]|uniref:Uncharacterized protein n=1 Tax=Lichtheimia ornata TaxID=688661 RepID=A0AAD7XR88_9FUNG|nr:uncharacterized protein O0I10_012987 [Lichtheimia ornata]KAJ8651455.1 hypothetical protein O0I10_012987 [Lichtheimia ornata]
MTRAAERRDLQASTHLHVLEDDQHSGEGVLSQPLAEQSLLASYASSSSTCNHAKPIDTATPPNPSSTSPPLPSPSL